MSSGLICGGVFRTNDDKRAEVHLVNRLVDGKSKTSGVRIGSGALVLLDMRQMYNDGIRFHFNEENEVIFTIGVLPKRLGVMTYN